MWWLVFSNKGFLKWGVEVKYVGYVLRGNSSEFYNLVLEGFLEGVYFRGRLRKKWMDDILGYLRYVLWGKED